MIDDDSLDLVTFGETMLRYSPPGDGRLETSERFDVHVAGAESNVAAAASRLGLDVAWLSRLPDSSLGRRITRTLRSHGIDPHVDWTENGRVGTYYLEPGGTSRTASVTYDRDNTPIRKATLDTLSTAPVERAEAVHTTGITPALSETLADTTGDLLSMAGETETTRVFDVNYREKLWSATVARETLEPLLHAVDVLFVAHRDAATVFDAEGTPTEVARSFGTDYGIDTVVVTRGTEGATALRYGDVHHQSTFDAADTHPVGTGDAFVGGFLAADIAGASLDRALSMGAATAALKREIPGDIAAVNLDEVESLVDGSPRDISR